MKKTQQQQLNLKSLNQNNLIPFNVDFIVCTRKISTGKSIKNVNLELIYVANNRTRETIDFLQFIGRPRKMLEVNVHLIMKIQKRQTMFDKLRSAAELNTDKTKAADNYQDEILRYYSGTELKSHFEQISENIIKSSIKPQQVYDVVNAFDGTGKELLAKYDERGITNDLIKKLEKDITTSP